MRRINWKRIDKYLAATLVAVLVNYYLGFLPREFNETVLVAIAGLATFPVVVSAWQALKRREITVDLLASVALVASLLAAEWASAVFINLMLTAARIFSAYTEGKSRTAIAGLLKLRPHQARIRRLDGTIVMLPIGRVRVGDLVVVQLGEQVPVDGEAVEGAASIDQASLTGESLPVSRGVGQKVLSATVVVEGTIVVRAEKVGKDTTFEKMVKLVKSARDSKGPIQTLGSRFAAGYIVIVFTAAIVLYVTTRDLRLVLALLLVACADDIAVAVPLTFSAALGRAARRGIIVKGGAFLEGLTKAKTVVFDKTGTLTAGRVKVIDVITFGKFTKEEVIKMAAATDSFSSHLLARAILDYAKARGIAWDEPKKFGQVAGQGSWAQYGEEKVYCGRRDYVEKEGVVVTDEQERAVDDQQSRQAGALVYVGRGQGLAGVIVCADAIRPQARAALAALRREGMEYMVMLTGDNDKVAGKVAGDLKLDSFAANLTPADKLERVKALLKRPGKLVMVGDGVNDAAALALADIGVAMGAVGSDAAIEAADVALMQDDLMKVAEARKIGKAAVSISRQNFVIWGAVNLLGMYLVFAKMMGPAEAAAYNFATDFLPIMNAIRMFRYKI
ncbi:MAG: cation-translocating P-type ATPase [Candidatus Andersenbacteria bacterium]|nr:cation-translocating P-type ATPase [bacterium]MDZ4225238.1 cation-translocating P-type ATPase [Candidatus Andersenbacteria bacterium]